MWINIYHRVPLLGSGAYTEVLLEKFQHYGRSTVASDNMQDKFKKEAPRSFSYTRWNSYYDAVLRVVENSLTELNEVYVNIEEHCAVLKPLSRGLDILQGEDNCYYGALLPTLATIIKKTKAIKPDLSMTTGLADAVESSIKK